jgi:predicted GTPase
LSDRKLCKDEDVDEYFDEIKQCMISKKVLMVVDDVDKTENLGGLQLPIHKHVTNVDCKSEVLVTFEIGKN